MDCTTITKITDSPARSMPSIVDVTSGLLTAIRADLARSEEVNKDQRSELDELLVTLSELAAVLIAERLENAAALTAERLENAALVGLIESMSATCGAV